MVRATHWLAAWVVGVAVLMLTMYGVYRTALVGYRETRTRAQLRVEHTTCVNSELRRGFEHECNDAERELTKMYPGTLALLDAISVLYPCGVHEERCAQVVKGIAEVSTWVWILMTASVLSAAAILCQTCWYNWRNVDRDLLPSGYSPYPVNPSRPALAWS
jgi:hypothetical protein